MQGNNQIQEEIIRQLLAAQQQRENEQLNSMPSFSRQINDYRQNLGNFGKALSTSNNPTLAKIGNGMYKYSGQQALNTLKSNAGNAIQTGIQNIGSKLASASTVGN